MIFETWVVSIIFLVIVAYGGDVNNGAKFAERTSLFMIIRVLKLQRMVWTSAK